jgi:hypothetical protein
MPIIIALTDAGAGRRKLASSDAVAIAGRATAS